MIELPANFVTNIASTTSAFLGNFSPFIVLIAGLLVGMLIIGFLLDNLHRR